MELTTLLSEIRGCTICKDSLPLGPHPVLKAHKKAKILIAGQAPGTKVHASGIPWDDASGKRLRQWMDISEAVFYDEERVAIVPMGFCYPGKGTSGDLPPRPECAQNWHHRLLPLLPNVRLTLLIGRYAQNYYLGNMAYKTLTDCVKDYEACLKRGYLPLPHPSPRNIFWLKKNSWMEEELIPILQAYIKELL